MTNRDCNPSRRGALGLALLPFLLMTGNAPAAELRYDIVISGGSFSAVAAALAAARVNPDAEVLLIEPTDWLGGQATSQGVSAIDNAWHAPAAAIMRDNEPLYYPADYLDWLDRMKTAPAEAPGEGYAGHSSWVSRHAYDPRTGAWALGQMATEYPNLTVKKLTVLKDLEASGLSDGHGEGRRIDSLTLIERIAKPGYTPFDDFLSEELPDWYTTEESHRFIKSLHTVLPRNEERGMVVIDASEVGDAMVLSGAVYTQGREAETERIAEDGTLPELNDSQTKATVYPFAMTTAGADSEEELKAPWPDFDDFLAARTADYYSLGSHSWTRVWTYRRLRLGPGGTANMDTINTGDVTMQNWHPGNDYVMASWLLDMAQANAQATGDWAGGVNLTTLAGAEKLALGWYFWLKARLPGGFPESDTRYLRGDDGLNMMGTAHGLAKFPYIRGTRRLVGLDNFRITGRYWVDTQATGYSNETSFRFYDSVGIGNYAADTRSLIGSTGISPPIGQPAPFYIPYRALASHNVRNLLAAGKTMAQTYITNSAYRLHPIEWASGTAAGTAAALMSRDGVTNHDLLAIDSLREMQSLVAANSPIHWEYRGEPVIPPRDGDLVVNDFRGLPVEGPFEVEAYHPSAVRAEILLNGLPLGETSIRANGRLRFLGDGIPAGSPNPSHVEARLYDAAENLLAILTDSVRLTEDIACELIPGVTDNDEGAPWFTTEGPWTVASAQPDRWCEGTYHYTDGAGGQRTAKWLLKTETPGIHEVAIWYPAAFNRATDAPFQVHHAEGIADHAVNQRENGGRWVVLGQYPFRSGADAFVTLSNTHGDSGDLVIADAVRVRLVEAFEQGDAWVIE